MLKRLFHFSLNEDDASSNGSHRNGSAGHRTSQGAVARAKEDRLPLEPDGGPAPRPDGAAAVVGHFVPFEEIYRNASFKQPKVAYDILKVAEMVHSPHVSGLSLEAKRCAVLMALDVAGVETEDLLQDAMARQRALNDYEEALQNSLREFEANKNRENTEIQAELDRLTARYMARIQGNVDEVARQQDAYVAWQKEKQQESQCIAEAASFCTPQSNASNANSLSSVLVRCGVEAAGKRP
ncbi:MAG: hypothetical protein ABSH46_17120 [Bryobacteraceae bacterium]|jgi:hypothetical protein